MKNKKALVSILLVFVIISIISLSTLSVYAQDYLLIGEDEVCYVDVETDSEPTKAKDNEQKADSKDADKTWNVIFWAGSAGCLALAIVLAIRAGNKKYGK